MIRAGPSRKPLDRRRILTGILFVLKTGIAWDDLPSELGWGCGKTCRESLRLWHVAGVWHQLHALLLADSAAYAAASTASPNSNTPSSPAPSSA